MFPDNLWWELHVSGSFRPRDSGKEPRGNGRTKRDAKGLGATENQKTSYLLFQRDEQRIGWFSEMGSNPPRYMDIIDPNNFHIHRMPIIQRLEKKLNSRVIVYTASSFHPFPEIMINDIPLFEDLLRSVAGADVGHLIINSPGGDPNVAEKIILMCRQRFPKGFNVIVPDFARSAATMVALGSDKILMGYLAELGPIDPQLGMAPLGEVK